MAEPVDCATCAHFYVTWRAETPRGCRRFGFESAHWPSRVVAEASGAPCEQREERPVLPRVSGTPPARSRAE